MLPAAFLDGRRRLKRFLPPVRVRRNIPTGSENIAIAGVSAASIPVRNVKKHPSYWDYFSDTAGSKKCLCGHKHFLKNRYKPQTTRLTGFF
jgi:hypothetical protein